MLPLVAGLAALTLVGVSRAAFRAASKLRAIPPHEFAAASGGSSTAFLRGGFEGRMSRGEAQSILGLRSNASRKDILQRHRVVMLANHPDRGGSNYFATKINEARDLLLSDQNLRQP